RRTTMTTPNSKFSAEIRSLPRPVWVLAAGTFIDRFGFFIFPFLMIFLTNAGMSGIAAGWAVGMIGIGNIIASFLGGYLTDRVGRKKTIAFSMYGGAITSLFLWATIEFHEQLGGFWAIYIVTMIYGLVRGMYHSASSSLVADLTPPNTLVAAFTMLRFAINLGFAFGMGAASLMFHLEASSIWLFGLDALTSITFGTIALTSLPTGLRTKKERAGWGLAFGTIFSSPAFLFLCLNCFVIATVINQWGASYAYHLKHELLYPEKIYGLLMIWNGILIVLTEIPISAWVRRYSPPKVIAAGTTVAALGFATIALVPAAAEWGSAAWGYDVTTLIIAGWFISITIFTIGEMITFPMQGAYVALLAPNDMRGRYNGATGFMWASATVVGPPLGMILLGASASILCNFMFGIAIISSVLLVVSANRQLARR
ncbi:MAG: MFS transporter, partial [Verrucomicrobiota bacterium]